MKPCLVSLTVAALAAALVAVNAGCGATANGQLAALSNGTTDTTASTHNNQAPGRFPGGPGGPPGGFGPGGFGPPPGGPPMLAHFLNLTDEQEDQADSEEIGRAHV